MMLYPTAVADGAAQRDKIWLWPKNEARRVLHESLSAANEDEVETEQTKQNHGCSC